MLLFLAHGAIYLNLRTGGDLPERARAIARWASPAAAVAGIAFLAWTAIDVAGGDAVVVALAVIAAILLAVSAMSELARRPGLAFGLSAFAIVALFVTLFVELFPLVMPSSTSAAFDLTIANTSSSDYTLTVMTVVAVILVPVVVMYQSWTYWVFRKRVSPEEFDPELRNPLDVIRADQDDSPAQA